MKRTNFVWLTVLICLLCLPALGIAQELPYKEGTVWGITFVRTKPGMGTDYLKNLVFCPGNKSQFWVVGQGFSPDRIG